MRTRALRDDLGGPLTSEPYVLMKYLGTNGDRGAMKVFKVIAEEAPYFFNYTGTAANAVQPPYPLKARSRGAAQRVCETGSYNALVAAR